MYFSENFIKAFVMVIGCVLLGFILRKTKVFNDTAQSFLSKFLLLVLIPCLAFSAFMCDFNITEFKTNLGVFIFSFIFILVVIILSQFNFRFFDKEHYKLYSVMIALGQMTLFSIPIIKELYPNNNEVIIASNMITLAFRLYLYIYAYLVVSKTKLNKDNLKTSFKKIFLNPIMIAMILGIMIYLTQNIMFKVTIDDTKYSIFRIDKTLPAIYGIIDTLQKMTTPLAMFLIGLTLGQENTKKAFINKKAYVIALCRVVFTPLCALLLCYLTNLIKLTAFSNIQVMVITLCIAAPLSAVVNTYCISYDNEAYFASDVTFLSTLMALIVLPLLYMLVNVIF